MGSNIKTGRGTRTGAGARAAAAVPDGGEIWGGAAADRLLATMSPAPPPPGRVSPLEQEVAKLQAIGLPRLDPYPEIGTLNRAWFADASTVVIDAVVAKDKRALDAMDELVREVYRAVVIARDDLPDAPDAADGRAELLRSCEHWAQLTANYVRSALDRVAPAAAATQVRGTARERFLQIVAAQPGINSRTIREVINHAKSGAATKVMDEGQLSRLGNSLRAEGLVTAERGPRGLAWELTPRGEELLSHLQKTPATVHTGLVVTAGDVDSSTVAKMIRDDPPPMLSVVRPRNTVVYRRMGRSESPADDTEVLETWLKELFDDEVTRPSRYFRTDDHCYEWVCVSERAIA
jgi:hypothetical protein